MLDSVPSSLHSAPYLIFPTFYVGWWFFFFLHRKMMEHEPGETRKQFEWKALSLNHSPISPPVLFLEGSGEIIMLLLRAVALAFGT